MNRIVTKLACVGALAIGMSVALQTGAVAATVGAQPTAKAPVAQCVPGQRTGMPQTCDLGTYPWINRP